MKKFALILAALFVFMSASALAELTVVSHGFYTASYEADSYSTFVAEVRNDGDAPVIVDDGTYQITGPDGAAVTEGSFYGSYPYVIAPGATAYVIQNDYHEGISADAVSDITFEFIPGEAYSEAPSMYNVSGASFAEVTTEWDETMCEIVVTITNDGAESIRDPYVCYGLYDQNGNILMAESTVLYGVGVPVGQSVEAVFHVDELTLNSWTAAGVEPATVKGTAWKE